MTCRDRWGLVQHRLKELSLTSELVVSRIDLASVDAEAAVELVARLTVHGRQLVVARTAVEIVEASASGAGPPHAHLLEATSHSEGLLAHRCGPDSGM